MLQIYTFFLKTLIIFSNWQQSNQKVKNCYVFNLPLIYISEVRVCLIEKAAELGAHTLSGAVIETSGLAKLFPDWQESCPAVHQKVTVSNF